MEIETIQKIVDRIDIVNLIFIAGMFWVFNIRLDRKFDKIDQRFEKIDARFEKVDQRFDNIENRLTKLEYDMIEVKTILRLKECCMIQDERQIKKAE